MDHRKSAGCCDPSGHQPHNSRFGAAVLGVPSAMGAYVTGNVTAEIIVAGTFAAVVVLRIVGAAINAYPDWRKRREETHEAVSLGRHRRKQRHDEPPDELNDPGVA